MYLAYTVPGISYEAALNWPTWKLVARVRHCGYWVERDNRLMERGNR